MSIKVAQLKSFINSIFLKLGFSEKDSDLASDVILQAELTGVKTHGLAKLSYYVDKYNGDRSVSKSDITILNNHTHNILIDGNDNCGLVIGPKALKICIEKTKELGISVITVRNSGHFGCGNYYAWEFAKNNLIGIVMTNTAPLMAPYGGKKRELGTNPIVFSIPAKENNPIVLDMATSVAAYGKIQVAALREEPIPVNWANDEYGVPTTDPSLGLKGALKPLAEHKGYGLAVMVDALTSLLSQGEFGDGITSIENLVQGNPEKISHFILGIDPATFYNIEVFLNYVDSYINYIKSSPKAKGISEIYMPGEIEFNLYNQALEKGVIIESNFQRELYKIIKKLGFDIKDDQSVTDWIIKNY